MDKRTAGKFITEVATLIDTITSVRKTDTTTVVAEKLIRPASYS